MEQNQIRNGTQERNHPSINVLQIAVQHEMLSQEEATAMSKKTATISARVIPSIKREAEEILSKLGVPLSVVVDALYRQIILRGDIPEEMRNFDVEEAGTEKPYDEKSPADLQEGYEEMERGEGIPLEEAFADLKEMLKS